MKIKLSLFVIIFYVMASCATIFTGTHDSITFKSTPPNAAVYIDGLEICKTPCTKNIRRSLSDQSVELKLNGYKTKVLTLDRKFNTVSIINLTCPIGWAVDLGTGALIRYSRKGYEINLEKSDETAALSKEPSEIRIDTENKVVELYVMEE